ncbi:MAG: hypothetical protein IKB71_06375 [Lentisphaeria bacterium]|nr:hypothetical protein [Lentisphaeria bacterium]
MKNGESDYITYHGNESWEGGLIRDEKWQHLNIWQLERLTWRLLINNH